jgi:phosphopantothenoylcysteine decarboxylase/phosphopantothenate--cysteine ligase
MVSGKKIILGITGSIAAYKSILLLRLLVKEGAEVKILMTPSARSFVSPLVLSTLSGHEVLIELSENDRWENHVALGRWADLMVIAPLSCNTLSKMSVGLCDNLFMAVYLSATCPVMIAPAMDEDMWKHPATRQNIQLLLSRGHRLIPVGKGELASGLIGEGRMAEPEHIFANIRQFFEEGSSLTGKKILITAGPTYEAIDPVRFIGNHSSGKMGFAIAEELLRCGADVTLISGPASVQISGNVSKKIFVESAAEMLDAVTQYYQDADIIIMAAAVADYTPVVVNEQKIKKGADTVSLELKKTTDILQFLGREKKAHQLLIGFALETENGADNARKKLTEKNADAIVLNQYVAGESGFGSDTNKITIFHKNGTREEVGLKSKKEVAADIVRTIKKMLHA